MRGKGMRISNEIKEGRDARAILLLRKLGIIRRTSWRGGASRRRPIQTAKQDSTEGMWAASVEGTWVSTARLAS